MVPNQRSMRIISGGCDRLRNGLPQMSTPDSLEPVSVTLHGKLAFADVIQWDVGEGQIVLIRGRQEGQGRRR